MNPLVRCAALSSFFLTLAACHPLNGSTQATTDESSPMPDNKPQARHNPQPTQAYRITLTIANAPGPFASIRGVAQYDVLDDACLPPADSLPGGVPMTVRTNEPFVLTQVSENQYEGTFHIDLIRDEDYFGHGVCHWRLMDVRVRLRATGADGETRFVPDLDIAPESVLPEQAKTTYFWKGGYPRDELDDFVDGGETVVTKFKPELRDDLFSITLTAKKVQP